MTESAGAKVVVSDFDDEFRLERSVLHRLGPSGLFPVKPGGLISFSSFLVSSARSFSLIVDVKPT
jgi:hypothetical protein